MNTSSRPIEGFHHIAMRVRDFDRSVDFYKDFFGMTEKIQWGAPPARIIMLDMGNGGILELFEKPDLDEQTTNPQFLHLCFRCPDVDGVIAKARALGLQVTVDPKDVAIDSRPTGPTPVRLAFFKGPEGELLELFDSKAV